MQNDFETNIYNKIQEKQELTERELERAITLYEIDRITGDNNRWSRNVMSIVSIKNETYAIVWQEGLTENQPDQFYEQPYKVTQHSYKKQIIVTEWVKDQN